MPTELTGMATAAEPSLAAVPRSALVGREMELARLRGALSSVCSGGCVVLSVLGEPGIGKSRLLSELGALAEGEGCLVLSGRAGELERDEPFGVFRDALDDYVGALERRLLRRLGREALGELAAVLPALGALGCEPEGALESERYRAHRATRALLEALGVERPLVLLLDDLHWADEPSLELLGALLRRRPRRRVLIACAYRPRQAGRRLLEALQEEVVCIEPGPLDLEAARALLSPVVQEARVRALHRESGGVPLYLEELARVPERPQSQAASVDVPLGAELPVAVALALGAELEALPEEAAALARGAAVAGDPFELSLAAAAAGLEERDALAPLDELVERDLVRPTEVPRRLRFRHPLVRRAVYQSASAGSRIAAHERATVWLEHSGARAEAVAHHLAVSARPGDARAARLLSEAGHSAASRAPAVAARWFGEALRVLPEGEPGWRLGLLAARARALVSAGHLVAGLEALGEALSLAPAEPTGLRLGLTTACAAVENLLGRHGHAQARLRAALDGLADRESAEAAALHIQLGATAAWASDFEAALAHVQPAVAAARAVGDELLEATATTLLAFGGLGLGKLEPATRAITRAGAILDACSDEALAARLELALFVGHMACFSDRFADGLRWFERGIAVSRRSGQDHLLVQLMSGQTLALATLGRLAAADEVASAALDAARLGANKTALCWALRLRCWVSLLAGDLPDALRAGEECVELVRAIGHSQATSAAGWMVGLALLEAGEPARATALVLELGGGPSLRLHFPAGRCIGYEVLTRAALASGRLAEAIEWAERAERSARGLGDGIAASLACRARAAVLLEQGDAAGAARAAFEAVTRAERPGARIEPAAARLLAGRALAAAGDPQAAVRELERAEVELSACGAKHLRDEAARELRALGRRVGRSHAPRKTSQSLSALSNRELEVAELVASGHTNKQIAAMLHISVNTVETHLKRILAKLEAPNRTAVAAALERARDHRIV